MSECKIEVFWQYEHVADLFVDYDKCTARVINYSKEWHKLPFLLSTRQPTWEEYKMLIDSRVFPMGRKNCYGSSLNTNIKTLERCKDVYNELHTIVLNKMTYVAYTLEDFLHDPGVLMAVMAKYKNRYEEWFNITFPDGAASSDAVLEMLDREEK